MSGRTLCGRACTAATQHHHSGRGTCNHYEREPQGATTLGGTRGHNDGKPDETTTIGDHKKGASMGGLTEPLERQDTYKQDHHNSTTTQSQRLFPSSTSGIFFRQRRSRTKIWLCSTSGAAGENTVLKTAQASTLQVAQHCYTECLLPSVCPSNYPWRFRRKANRALFASRLSPGT